MPDSLSAPTPEAFPRSSLMKRCAKELLAWLGLPRERRQLAHDVITSGVGMHGEPFRFHEDGLCTIHNCDFLASPRFERAYAAGVATGSWRGWSLRWRAYILCWAAEWAFRLTGDFVECGVNKGGNVRMILDYLGADRFDRRFFLLDTFNGFDPGLMSEDEKAAVEQAYEYSDCLDEVTRTFAPFPSVKIIPGAVPGTLPQIDATTVAFVSIDMNCVEPEIAAANFLWGRMPPGGIMILDDYGFAQHYRQKIAFDEFAAAKGLSFLSLPTGQGIIFKPVA